MDRNLDTDKIDSILERMATGITVEYKSWEQVKKDLIKINRSSYAVKRLVAFLLADLKHIVSYPIYVKDENKRGKQKYMYWSLDEMNDVENCIVFALYKVAKRIREQEKSYVDYFNKVGIYNKDLNSVKKILAKMIRNAATNDIYKTLNISNKYEYDDIGRKIYQKKVICMDYEVLAETINGNNNESSIELALEKKELTKLINNTIDSFLIDKDKLDTTIFLNHIMADAKYDKYELEKLTQERIARINNVNARTVRRREEKLLKEFRAIWKEKIEPYL
ncbi:hypothetical protein SAMN05428976_10259 [Clostridium sp. USBA 49]|uniref:hypothetical protein n=1 Tax=Clostridium sp. USBA 49 TaxID=1881060 RepID=UPI0009992AAF|nr:hypothetical protein [Clostridium sp. USBA 49]SKA75110.1 hypothetical protein SAMN05428976_10259 [Clostridium sp. USBA 49]